MSAILIKNGRILDPASGRDEIGDLFLRDGMIAESPDCSAGEKSEDMEALDASGCYVMPGLIDMHVHLRDPGQTWK